MNQSPHGAEQSDLTPERAPVPRALLSPRYWPQWLLLGLLRILVLLPVPALLALGAGCGRLFQALVPSRRRIVRINLRLSFPQFSDERRRRMASAHFRAVGMGVFEVLLAWFASDRRLRRRVQFEGLEHLEAAKASGAGLLLLTGHFTTMELGCRLLHLAGCPFHGMYRRADSVFFDYWIRRLREFRVGRSMVPKEDLKAIVRLLRKGAAVWYGPDQTLEVANTAFVPFFGVPTRTLTATSRLAKMGRATVLPYFPVRHGGRYTLVFLPPFEHFPSGDDVADARRVNEMLEHAVRRAPEQYFWVHRRFKDGPPELPDPYA